MLDVTVVASLLTTIVTWGLLVAECYTARATIAGDNPPAYFADGPASVQESIYAALRFSEQFKTAGVVTLVVLTLRIFKYFKHQPRLAVLTDAIASESSVGAESRSMHCPHAPLPSPAVGLTDSLHFGILLGIVLTMYGTWGHFLFGGQVRAPRQSFRSCPFHWRRPFMQAPDWSSTGQSIPTLIRFIMYDYDLDA